MKRSVSFTLSLILLCAMILSACAPAAPTAPAPAPVSNPPAEQPTSAPVVQPTTAPVKPTEPPVQAKVELTMWTWKLNHVPGLEAVAKDFEAKTGIKVTVTAINPDDAYRTRITTSSQSGDLADIISYWTGGDDFWALASSGVLVDLTNKVDDSWKNSFVPG